MNSRVAELIGLLGLQPHPEGGHFVEAFRSPLHVSTNETRGNRSALTVIYFLLVRGGFSRWHRVLSDEAWHWYEGSSLELLTVGSQGGAVLSTTLGPLSSNSAPLHVVPAGCWQAARPKGEYTLVGCSVAPGFDYADFTLLSSVPERERPVFRPSSVSTKLL
jgi:predicted cupin superfamily sugar epimerase